MRVVNMAGVGAIVFSLAAPSGQASAADAAFSCTGKRVEDGYPYGRRVIGKLSFTVLVHPPDQVEIIGGAATACAAAATCTAVVDANHVATTLNRTPPYSESFDLNRRSGAFTHSGGGLDGEWRVTGRCVPAQGFRRPR